MSKLRVTDLRNSAEEEKEDTVTETKMEAALKRVA
jgi:hypothetical protein